MQFFTGENWILLLVLQCWQLVISVKKVYHIFLTGKFIPVAYGVQKLQISCVVEDDKVGTDFLEEKITEFEDFVSETWR